MSKAKISRKKVVHKKKSFFLPPSSPYRLPLPLLIALSLTFFIVLVGYIISLSSNQFENFASSFFSSATQKARSEKIMVEKAQAAEMRTITPSPIASLGYCLNVPILMYHHVQPMAEAEKLHHAQLTVDRDVFERQLAYLNERNYKTISLDTLTQALIQHETVPANSIVLTFDDGYRDAYLYVYPLLKQYNVIGNFMIPTGLIENTDYMTWNQVKEMSGDSHVSLFNHTWSHADLRQSTREKIDFELTTSTQDFVNNIGHMSTVFAYPYGSYSDQSIDVLRSHGFTAAVTTEAGRLQCDSYLMKLKRDHVGNAPLSAYGL